MGAQGWLETFCLRHFVLHTSNMAPLMRFINFLLLAMVSAQDPVFLVAPTTAAALPVTGGAEASGTNTVTLYGIADTHNTAEVLEQTHVIAEIMATLFALVAIAICWIECCKKK